MKKRGMTTAQLQSRLKGGRLMLAEVDGDLWATNSYWLVKVPDPSILRDLLAEFNLEAEPMVCVVDRTIVRTEADPPDVEFLLDFPKGEYVPLERATYGGKPFVMEFGHAGPTVAFEHPTGSAVALGCGNVEVVEALAGSGGGGARWLGLGSETQAVKWGIPGDDAMGLLMPVRAEFQFGSTLHDAA